MKEIHFFTQLDLGLNPGPPIHWRKLYSFVDVKMSLFWWSQDFKVMKQVLVEQRWMFDKIQKQKGDFKVLTKVH